MIRHALEIVRNELDDHLTAAGQGTDVALGNFAEGVGIVDGNVKRDHVVLSVVNLQEEKTLKNTSANERDDANQLVRYRRPPLNLNLALLAGVTHADYADALLVLSRVVTFFQHRSSFTQEDVAPSSLTRNAPVGGDDRLDTFRLVFALWSPSLEEVNHLWGTLGGRQYPFALYTVRMLELRSAAVAVEGPLVTEVVGAFSQRAAS